MKFAELLSRCSRRLSVLCLGLACSAMVVAQQCLPQPSFEQAQREPVLVDLEDGVVMELRSRLMWYRCNFGQEFDVSSQSCTGQPVFAEYGRIAEQLADFQQHGFDDWRIPSNAELRSLFRVACVAEDTSLSDLPDFVSERYWSSTVDYYDDLKLQAIDFASGHNAYLYSNIYAYARPVRSMVDHELENWDELLDRYGANERRTIYGRRLSDGTLELHEGAPCPLCAKSDF